MLPEEPDTNMTFERRFTNQAPCSNGISSVLDQFAERNCKSIGTGTIELLATKSADQRPDI